MGLSGSSIERVPIVDLAAIRDGAAGARRCAEAVREACEKIGFFYLTNHGVDRAVLRDVWRQTQTFFALPAERKLAVAVRRDCYRGYIPLAAFSPNDGGGRPDLYEGYKVHLDLRDDDPLVRLGVPLYGANVWPDGPPEFRRAMEAYWSALTRLSEELLRVFARSLELEPAVLLDCFDKPLSNISLLHYPHQDPAAGKDQMGIHPHRDTDAFTVLLPDPVGGLQVRRRDGHWIEAPDVPGAFIVNVGNMMECWTAGRFVSTPHRVVNRSGRERYAVAYFAIPSYETVIRPIAPGSTGATDRLEDEIAVGPFMEALYASNWA